MDWRDLSTEDQERARGVALRALRIYFAEKRWSRLAMFFILLLTGVAGVAASWCMLQAGLGQMWLRYPLAVLVAWGSFLVLVWLWVQIERRYFTADEEMAALLKGRDPAEAMRRLKKDDSSVLGWFGDLPVPDLGDDSGCVFLVIAAVAVGVIFFALAAIFSVLMAAPILFAEVFVDAVLISALYKRMKPLHEQWWVVGAVRQTCRPVVLTMAALFLCALVFGYFAPGAKSIGGVMAELRGKPEAAAPLLELPKAP